MDILIIHRRHKLSDSSCMSCVFKSSHLLQTRNLGLFRSANQLHLSLSLSATYSCHAKCFSRTNNAPEFVSLNCVTQSRVTVQSDETGWIHEWPYNSIATNFIVYVCTYERKCMSVLNSRDQGFSAIWTCTKTETQIIYIPVNAITMKVSH
jgi:hypothetical protein